MITVNNSTDGNKISKSSLRSFAFGMAFLSVIGVANASSCRVYEHRDYRGWVRSVDAGLGWKYVGSKVNDKISSVQVDRGCTFVGYEHRDFKGWKRVYTSNTAYVGNDVNDKISSGTCNCQAQLGNVNLHGRPEQIVSQTISAVIEANKGRFQFLLAQELGRGDMIAKGITLYNMNLRIGRFEAQSLNPSSFRIVLSGNYLYFKSTTPTPVGSYGDPAFETHFDVVLTGAIHVNPQTRQANVSNVIVHVPQVRAKSRNVSAFVIVNVINWIQSTTAGRRAIENAAHKGLHHDITNMVNKELSKIHVASR